LQIDARKQLAKCEVQEPGTRNKPTLIETRRQRCRQARYQRYTKVHELHRGGQTQLARIIREAPACVVLYDSFGENVLASVL
jgi:DNA-binding IclR family transcriptional regulator